MANRRREQRPKDLRQGPARSNQAGQSSPTSNVREKLGLAPKTPPGSRPRRESRRDREARRQRQLFISLGAVAILLVVIVAGFASNEYIFKPRKVLATVNGHEIRRKDYWKVRSYDLLNQASQYQQLAQMVEQSQQSQYLALAQQAVNELDDVWGSTKTDPNTLQKMIDDQLYLQNMEKLGITIGDQDVKDYIDQQFEPANSPIYTPTPSPTLIPTRAAWATETAAASTATVEGTLPAGSEGAAGTPEAGTPDAASSPVAEASPLAGSPVAEGSAAARSPEAGTPEANSTPDGLPTPNSEQARQTAVAGYELFKDQAFGDLHMSTSDYEALIIRPLVARQKVRSALEAQIGQSAEQVHAEHILVGTKDLADSLYQQLQDPNANFEQLAKDNSTDTGTAPNGGDLGWFPHGIMVAEFDKVAFETPVGSISQPVQTQFGWHIIKVLGHEQDRALTDDMISQLKSKAVSDWEDEQRTAAKIDAVVEPTATATSELFEAPSDAPPTPAPSPTAIPAASPQASPAAQ
jgi:parvulin-like peptidyl-prolyl isomerase